MTKTQTIETLRRAIITQRVNRTKMAKELGFGKGHFLAWVRGQDGLVAMSETNLTKIASYLGYEYKVNHQLIKIDDANTN